MKEMTDKDIENIRLVKQLLDLFIDHMQNKKHGQDCCVAKIVAKYKYLSGV